ncbi:urea amidolyase associated protein UAAP2 [Rhizobium sp. YIM 134829]|uniref:urea amidolyase associated protein UAAP2 n=1 Tax=Rhizobium sp. YIM 134829 TaxID=3390453 RepID=UPI00397BB0D6
MTGFIETHPARTPETAVAVHEIAAERPFSTLIRKGQLLRIEDSYGQQAIDTLFYNAADTGERYSNQETMRAQNAAYITTGTRIMSSEGRVMLRMTADSCGRHDTSAGACSCESNTVRFGQATRYLHACRDNFVAEVARYGMSKRDVPANINFFMNVPITPSGEMTIVDGISAPGDYVELVAEMDVLLVISNCPQINNPCNGFDPTPVRVLVWNGEA